jgi:DNA-directed RNA polymerase specialized sigma24 family protein
MPRRALEESHRKVCFTMHNATTTHHTPEELEALSPELRQSIHLVHYSGFTPEQVAGLLDVTVEVVEGRLRAAEEELAA